MSCFCGLGGKTKTQSEVRIATAAFLPVSFSLGSLRVDLLDSRGNLLKRTQKAATTEELKHQKDIKRQRAEIAALITANDQTKLEIQVLNEIVSFLLLTLTISTFKM